MTAYRIRTRRQAQRIRLGISWGRIINEARAFSEEDRRRTSDRALAAAKYLRSDLMARAIIRTAYPWTRERQNGA